MASRALRWVLACALSTALSTAAANEIQQVEVVNLPEIQRIEGEVTFEGPLKTGSQVVFSDVVVSPVQRQNTGRLIRAGTVATDGFGYLVVSLAAEIKGTVTRKGTFGVLLVPEETEIERALRDDGVFLFPIEAKTDLPVGADSWVTAPQKRFEIAFPRYAVYLYNSSDKSVSANLYVYLSNS
jgi:hypothetical protein